MIAEALELRRLLSSVAGSANVAVNASYTIHLDTAGLTNVSAIDVDYGDGSTASLASTATSTTHPFATAGSFTPTVTITDANGPHTLALGLDPGFGSNGTKLETSAAGTGEAHAALLQQPDGQPPKLLVAGFASVPGSGSGAAVFTLLRYNLDGTLDTTFGTNGVATAAFTNAWGQAMSLALDSQHRIILVGGNQTHAEIDVARFNANGALDTSFGTGGTLNTNIGGGGGATAVVVASDDSLYVSGFAYDTDKSYFTVVRVTNTGAVDTTWGNGGYVRPGVGLVTYWEDSTAMALDPNGKLVLGGWKLWGGLDGWNFALTRLLPDGSTDTSFGDNGSVITDFDCRDDGANALAIQADGKIVVAGQTSDQSTSDRIYHFAVARYNPDGSPDSTFGGDQQNPGNVTLKIGNPAKDSIANTIAIQGDGRILVGGSSFDGPRQVFTLARLNPADGSLDGTFGVGGILTTGFTGDAALYGLALDPTTGEAFAVGTASNNAADYNSRYFALAKYLPDDRVTVTGSLAAPTNLLATAGTASGVHLSWNGPAGATYAVYRSTSSGFDTAAVAPLATNLAGTTYDDTTADTGTTYYYRIVATSADGSDVSAPSALTSFTTSGHAHDTLLDGGFESPRIGDGRTASTVTGARWTPAGGASYIANNSYLGNPPSPQGTQAIALENVASVSQQINFTGGLYAVAYQAAQRHWDGDPGHDTNQNLQILIDGVAADIPDVYPATTTWAQYRTDAFTVTPGPHTLTIAGLNSAGGYNCAFLDDVQLVPLPAITAAPIQATAGGTFSGVVATLAGAGPTTAAGFAVSVGFGDGTPAATGYAFDNGDGTFSVYATHAYAAAGAYPVSVTVADATSGASVSATGSAQVTAPVAPVVTGQAVRPAAGQSFSGALATFTEAGPGTSPDDYGIAIDFGDGTTGTGQAADNGDGTFSVWPTDAHTFATAAGYTITTTVTFTPSSQSASATSAATVHPPNLNPTLGGDASVDEGSPYTLYLSSTPDDGISALTGWTIDWGDGSTPTTLAASATSATHTFTSANAGRTITATASNGTNTDTATQTVAVTAVDPNLAISGIYGIIISTVGDAYTINFSATPKEPDDAPTQWTVDWGDGSASETFAGNVGSADHTFDHASPIDGFVVRATATTVAGNTASAAPLRVQVNDPAAPVAKAWFDPTGGPLQLSFYADNGNVTDPDLWTIDWGDGTVTTSADGSGFNVHSYRDNWIAGYTIHATATYNGVDYPTDPITTGVSGELKGFEDGDAGHWSGGISADQWDPQYWPQFGWTQQQWQQEIQHHFLGLFSDGGSASWSASSAPPHGGNVYVSLTVGGAGPQNTPVWNASSDALLQDLSLIYTDANGVQHTVSPDGAEPLDPAAFYSPLVIDPNYDPATAPSPPWRYMNTSEDFVGFHFPAGFRGLSLPRSRRRCGLVPRHGRWHRREPILDDRQRQRLARLGADRFRRPRRPAVAH
jgi:uncharacterized delta-60 repeat protein